MSQSAALDKPTLMLEDLDAFVDESIDAMDAEQLSEFKKASRRIMRDSKRRVSGSRDAAPEKVESV